MRQKFNITEVSHFDMKKGWFVAATDKGEKVVGTSLIPPFGLIDVEAEETEHPIFGKQWKVKNLMFPDVETASLALLMSGLVWGINEGKAQDVFDEFGVQIWSILSAGVDGEEFIEWKGEKRTPVGVLTDARGIGEHTAKGMVKNWAEDRHRFTAALNATRCGFEPWMLNEILNTKDAVQKFNMMMHNMDPYSVYDLQMFGLSFDHVDRLALQEWPDKAAIAPDDPMRFAGGMKAAFLNNQRDGHMCLPTEEVVETAARMLKISQDDMRLEKIEKWGLVIHNGFVYLKDVYEEEADIAARIMRINDTPYSPVYTSEANIRREFGDFEPDLEQVRAIQMALESKVCLITGGPGVGKTTIMEVLAKILEKKGVKFEFAAFMGSAARQIKLATGYPAQTLHMLFGLAREDGGKPLLEGYLIIDEMSTVSSELFHRVIKLCGDNVRLVLVGDVDQLPPVGQGEVFYQLLNSGLPYVRLTEIHRTDKGGAIARACRDVNNGILPTPDGESFLLLNKVTELTDRAMRGEDWLQEQKKEAQFITPLNSTRHMLNGMLQKKRNPKGADVPYTSVKLGDKVVQTKNIYPFEGEGIDVRNGMIGKAEEMSSYAEMVMREKLNAKSEDAPNPLYRNGGDKEILSVAFVSEDEREVWWYKPEDLKTLELGYAITVHKSQGKGFDHVVVVVPRLPPALQLRQIVYTAMSRAKHTLVVIAAPGALEACISSTERIRRYSNLAEFIKESELWKMQLA